MEKYKPYLIKPGIDDGSPKDFDRIRRGYRLLTRYRKTLLNAERAPSYVASSYNQDGEPYGIRENLTPWDAVEKIEKAIGRNRQAQRILEAHHFTVKRLEEGGIIIRNKEGDMVRAKEIPVFITEAGREKP